MNLVEALAYSNKPNFRLAKEHNSDYSKAKFFFG